MAILPAEFSDLEQFADWSLRTEAERYNKPLNSTMQEMQTFYDVAFLRLKAGMEYLDQFDLKNLPEDATLLLWLFYSRINVTFPVKVWRQPRVPDSGAAAMDCIVAPVV
jgi:hypothetical protein